MTAHALQIRADTNAAKILHLLQFMRNFNLPNRGAETVHREQPAEASGGQLYVFIDKRPNIEVEDGVRVIEIPRTIRLIAPIVCTLPLRLRAFHLALLKDTDVNPSWKLAKAVTRE